jgi:hypothetical protein
MGIKERAQICGHTDQWLIMDFRTPCGVLLLTKGGGSGMNIPYGGPLVTCGIVLLV